MGISEIVQLIISLVAAPTAIISVLFLIRQTRQLDETLRSQVYQGLIDNSLKIDQLLIDHPDFRKYIYGNEPVTQNTPNLETLMSVMEFMIDIVDNLGVQKKFIPTPMLQGWRNFAQEVVNSPAAKYFLETHHGWYSSGISDKVSISDSPSKKALLSEKTHESNDVN